MQLKTKKLLTKEASIVIRGLIISFIMIYLGNYLHNRYLQNYSSIIVKVPIVDGKLKINGLPNNEMKKIFYNNILNLISNNTKIMGYFFLIAAYPIYLATRFILWAIIKFNKKE